MTSVSSPTAVTAPMPTAVSIQVAPASFDRFDQKGDSKGDDTQKASNAPSPFKPQPALNLKEAFIVYQKGCAISKKRPLATTSFGGCHVLTIYDPVTKWSLLAHIDDCTLLGSLEGCLKAYMELLGEGDAKEKLARLQVGIRGGWKGHPESEKWGRGILLQLLKFGIQAKQIDKTDYQKKTKGCTRATGSSAFESAHHFTGGVFDPSTGKFQYFEKAWMKIDEKSRELFQKQHLEAFNKKIAESTPEEAADIFVAGPYACEIPIALEIVEC